MRPIRGGEGCVETEAETGGMWPQVKGRRSSQRLGEVRGEASLRASRQNQACPPFSSRVPKCLL